PPDAQASLPDPGDPDTFRRCRLDMGERQRHAESYALHRDLLQLRRDDGVLGAGGGGAAGRAVDGAVIAEAAFLLRFSTADGDDRLLIVNLGGTLRLETLPEPLLAPPEGRRW